MNDAAVTKLCRSGILKTHSLPVDTDPPESIHFLILMSRSSHASTGGRRVQVFPGPSAGPAQAFGWRTTWRQRSVTRPVSNAEPMNLSAWFHYRLLVSWVTFFHKQPKSASWETQTPETINQFGISTQVTSKTGVKTPNCGQHFLHPHMSKSDEIAEKLCD